MNEEHIVELFLKRDEQAIRESMNAFGAYCRAIASKILSDPADVEEVLADTWLGAWNTIPPQRPKYLRLYLGRIARNRAVDLLRRNGSKGRNGVEMTAALEELEECTSSLACPEQALEAKELGELINRFLKDQPQSHRTIFLRRYFYMEELSDIARSQGLRQVNVRMILSRTRKKLRQYLIQEGHIYEK